MGKRKYPPLDRAEVLSILAALGFAFKRQRGSHAHYERPSNPGHERAVVTVDVAISEFDEWLIKKMISQSKFSREQFYGATPKTAKKIR